MLLSNIMLKIKKRLYKDPLNTIKRKWNYKVGKNLVVRELSMLINKLKYVMNLLIKRFLYFNIYLFNIYYNIIYIIIFLI